MKTKTQQRKPSNVFDGTPKLLAALALAALSAASSAFGASQIWTNAPVDNAWTNVNNWIGRAVPGAVNSTTTSDTATFNSPIPGGGLGGASYPITNDFQRGVRYVLFDTASCGAYVFGSSLADNYLEVINSGNITINAPVANRITFNQPLRYRCPSSTNGRYDINNNATASDATLYIASITNMINSTTRPWNLVLAGSNTGTNTLANIDDGTVIGTQRGAILLDKSGTGTWILSGPNDLPQKTTVNAAHVYVNAGTLVVRDAGALGSITTPNLWVWSGGTLQIDNVTLNNAGISIYSGGTIRMNGSGTVNGVTVDGSTAGESMTLATTSSGDVMTLGNMANTVTGGKADTVLHVAGPGTVALPYSANYLGKWSLDAGTTQLSDPAALGTGANLNISAGATFDVSPLYLFGYSIYSLTTAGFSAGGTGSTVGSTAATIKADANGAVDLATGAKPILLTFTPTAFTGDTAHPALYISQGTLSIGGNTITVNNASGTPLGTGTYRLIQQASGSISSGGGYAVIVTGSGIIAGAAGSIEVSGGNVNLVVTTYAAKNLAWQGGNPDSTWDANNTANWLNGAALVAFTNSDNVTFDSTGISWPSVSLVGTLAPSSVTVNVSSPNSYSFGGSGAIVGVTGLTKKGNGTLVVQNVNTYQGGTIISNGTVQIGVANALPATSDVTVQSPGILDLNGNNNTIGALSGNGTVDTLSGGAPVLTVGDNNASGTFSGVLQNTFGTLGLTKNGNGALTFSSSNNYAGPTVVNAGQLILGNPNALGPGNSALTTANGGVLDLNGHNAVVASLAGSGGAITNSGATGTNTLTVLDGGGATYSGVINDSTNGAKVQLILLGNNELRFNGNCTYSAGTLVASGATLGIGYGAAGTGPFVLSNNATMDLRNAGGNSVFAGNPITIPEDNATVIFTSGQLGNGYSGVITGNATTTNSIAGPVSLSASSSKQYQPFLGRVVVQPGAEMRWSGSTIANGGDNTTFEINGTMHIKGGNTAAYVGTVSLGVLTGTGFIDNPVGSPNLGTGVYLIGAKGVDSVYSGTFSGTNSLVKVGPARLTLNGAVVTTNTDYFSYTNYLYAPAVSHFGNTTVTNGVLALVVPNSLSNSPAITLADAGAVLDATLMGYIQDQIDPTSLTVTNQLLVTNGVFELYANQTLTGVGTLQGSLRADSGSAVSPGNPIGRLVISGPAALGGLVRMELNQTNASGTNDLLAAASFAVTGDLVVTNAGPDVVNGDSFKLFNQPVSGFATISLPVATSGGSTYVWTNKLAVDGTIQLLSGGIPPVNTTPTNITAAVSGSTLTLSWPADHTGWRLLVQTNNLASGISVNALDWGAVAGSAATNQVSITIDPAKPTEFYRLVYP